HLKSKARAKQIPPLRYGMTAQDDCARDDRECSATLYNSCAMKKLLFATLLLTLSCFAQTTPAKPRTIIHAAKLFDAKAGRVLTNQYIVIEGDKVVSVGGTAPAGAKVIELPNVLPGLI